MNQTNFLFLYIPLKKYSNKIPTGGEILYLKINEHQYDLKFVVWWFFKILVFKLI